MNTRNRIAILLVVYSLTILTLLGVGVYTFQNNYAYSDFYKRLETRATIAVRYNLNTDTLNAESYRIIRERHLERLDQEKEYLIPIPKNSTSAQLARVHKVPVQLIQTILRKGQATAQRGTTLYAGVKADVGEKQYIVIISAKNYYVNHHLTFLKNILGVGVLLSLVVIIYLSFYFSKHVFDPIRRVTKEVKNISTENTYLRLDEKGYKHEIKELIYTFNDLLNRIDTTMGAQKNFISNASHELATPLTSIIGEAEVTLKRERKPAEYQQALQNILVQGERLNEITRSLLLLAQVGFRSKKLVFEVLRSDELIWEAKAIVDRLNPNNQIKVLLNLLPEDPKKLNITGNRHLLQLALVNLLNNACKYSHNEPVFIHLGATDHQILILIEDKGVGIPAKEIQFIFDPFFRASNTTLFEGYGIGLSLTRNIVTLHNGLLNVSSTLNMGTKVQLKLPSLA